MQNENNNKRIVQTVEMFVKLGFKNIDINVIKDLMLRFFENQSKIIMVMSHTCNHDFLLGLLLFSMLSIPIKMFTNFKNPLFDQLSRKLGMIKSQKNKSNTEVIIETLKKQETYAFLISLGKTQHQEKIHSGYFYIAKKLQIPIIVVGFDYFLQAAYLSPNTWFVETQETYEHFQTTKEPEILLELNQIWPLKYYLQVGFKPELYPHYQKMKRDEKSKIENFQIPTPPSPTVLYFHVLNKCLLNNNNNQTNINNNNNIKTTKTTTTITNDSNTFIFAVILCIFVTFVLVFVIIMLLFYFKNKKKNREKNL